MRWSDYRYEIVTTKDSSPSLKSLGIETQEMMHHSGGAYEETELIYGESLREKMDQGHRKVLSVGLGIGYNEILTAVEALKRNLRPDEVLLASYESEDCLKELFLRYLHQDVISEDDEVSKTYDEVMKFFLQKTSFEPQQIKKFLLTMLEKKTWLLKGALTEESLFEQKFNVIFYDLFSSKTDSKPWSEDFLMKLWQIHCDDSCLVTTYANTGALKRSLKAHGFEIIQREGFHSRRSSTLARRG